jgi:predicted nucleic acid-binding protein
MRVVVDTNVFISAALKEKSIPGMAVHIVAESGVLLKSTIREQELFVTPGPPAPCAPDPAALSRLAA